MSDVIQFFKDARENLHDMPPEEVDELLDIVLDVYRNAFRRVSAENAKLLSLVQEGVNAMALADAQIAHTGECPWPVTPPDLCGCPLGDARRTMGAFLSRAKDDFGVVPTPSPTT